MFVICSITIIYLIIRQSSTASKVQGPLFIKEPPGFVEFLNDQGVIIDCIAHGEPQPHIEWLTKDSHPVHDSGWLRRVYNNGSIVLAPFAADQYRQDVHATVYRCSASNTHGRIISSPVVVRATTKQQEQQLQAQVYDEYVIRDNTAVLRCHIPTFLKEDLQVSSWVREDNLVIRRQPERDSKLTLAEDGKLYVSSVKKADGGINYWCRVRHKLTNQTFLSTTCGKIVVTEPHRNVPLKITDALNFVTVNLGREFLVLPCAAHGYPAPTYRWLEQNENGDKTQISRSRQRDGALILRDFDKSGIRTFTCVATNNIDSVEKTTKVLIRETLDAYVEPQSLLVDSGQEIRLNCTVKGYPITTIRWMLNGKKLKQDDRRIYVSDRVQLLITNATEDDKGMYQCFVSNEYNSAQGTAQIQLGAIPSKLVKKFSGRILQPGPTVELLCSATGTPKPSITWSRFGHTITSNKKYEIRPTIINGIVTSKLVIKNIRSKDGGEYTCTASNEMSTQSHTDRLKVFGIPVIQPMDNVTVAAGEDVMIRCYVTGYPLKVIKWRRDGPKRRLPKTSETSKNGTLILKDVRRGDGGRYKCTAIGGQRATSFVTIKISKKPEIGTLSSPGETEEGKLVTLVCTVTDGDEPIRITWMKDNQPLSIDLGIDFMEAKKFSFLQIGEVRQQHSGNYTCVARNVAGSSTKTVDLTVLVSPKWISLSSNISVLSGSTAKLDCISDGFPKPTVKWKDHKGVAIINKIHARYNIYDNGTMLIVKSRKSDSGNYQCEVSNNVYPDLVGYIDLTVGVAPDVHEKESILSVTSNNIVNVQCKVTGSQPMTIKWTKDGKSLSTTGRNRFKVKTFRLNGKVESRLTLMNSTVNDSGQYACNAKNQFGHNIFRQTLIVQDPTTTIATTIFTTTDQANMSTSAPKRRKEMRTHEYGSKVYTIYYTNSVPLPTKSSKTYVEVSTRATKLKLNFTAQFNATNQGRYNLSSSNTTLNSSYDIDSSSNHMTYTLRTLLEKDTWVLYIAPGIIAVIIFFSIVITAIVLLSTRKRRRCKIPGIQTSSPARAAYEPEILRQKMIPLKVVPESRYGKIEQSKLWTTNKQRENGYRIPDYCSGMKPYGTLQAAPQFGRRLPTISPKQHDRQQSL
ncbi:Uncharacterised protein g3441 [Pycnogonum litorale]